MGQMSQEEINIDLFNEVQRLRGELKKLRELPKVKMKIDNDCEMLEIHLGDKCLFMGNFWDFDRPEGIEQLIKDLGHDLEVEQYSYE